jgi:hypothetical protein
VLFSQVLFVFNILRAFILKPKNGSNWWGHVKPSSCYFMNLHFPNSFALWVLLWKNKNAKFDMNRF